MYHEVMDAGFQLRNWRRSIQKTTYSAFTKHDDEEICNAVGVIDAKSLYDILLNETNGGSDRRTALDIQALREELGELRGKVRWIDHIHMPADCLTKKNGKTDVWMQLLKTGRFGVAAESATMSERLETRRKTGYNKR